MTDITPEALRTIQQSAPNFIVAVAHSKKRGLTDREPPTILLTLDAFWDDPILLYACVWYASTRGVVCTIVPQD